MSLISRIANGALEGFVAGASVGAAANGLTSGMIPTAQNYVFMPGAAAGGAGKGLVNGGILGALAGGIMGALGHEHPVATVIDGALGSDHFSGSVSGGLADVLSTLAQHLRRS